MKKSVLPTAFALSALLTLASCATGDRHQTSATDDATLNRQVTQAVHGVAGISSTDLQVSTRDGVVSLKGHTATQSMAQDAIEAARHVEGVQKVDYDIRVDDQQ